MYYEPEADSHLMVECIQNLSLDVESALDVGVGSGILSQAVCERWPKCTVVGIDINEEALEHSKETVKGNFEARKSNLFENVSEKFDLIVCNPPYLPQSKLDDMDDVYTKALVSGPKGYEYIVSFLEKAKEHLKKGGKILLLFSNLSNKEHIDYELLNSMYAYKEIVKKNVGLMEDLYVYELWIPDVVYELQNPQFVSRGRRGMIIRGLNENQNVVVKIPLDETYTERICVKEAQFLQMANKVGVGPKYVSHTADHVMMEFISGKTWKHWVKSASKKDIKTVLDKVRGQCVALDEVGISKMEMTNPVKHILIDSELNVTLVDYERAVRANKPKNVAQFAEFEKKVAKNYL